MRATKQQGFTLIELVIGMVVFAIAMVAVINVMLPQARQGVDPILQVRAIALGQSLMNEITAKPFDDNGNLPGSMQRCNEIVACTRSISLGPDGSEVRADFNDVDDYHGLNLQGGSILSALGSPTILTGNSIYTGFSARVSVFYDDNADGINDDDIDQNGIPDTGTLVGNMKLVSVTITTPSDDNIVLATLVGNF